VVHIETAPKNLPALRDPDDLIFLDLAVYGNADALISGDGDLLAVKSQLGPINVFTVAEFAAWLSGLTNEHA